MIGHKRLLSEATKKLPVFTTDSKLSQRIINKSNIYLSENLKLKNYLQAFATSAYLLQNLRHVCVIWTFLSAALWIAAP